MRMSVERTLTPPIAGMLRTGAREGIRVEQFDQIVREHQRRIYRVLLALVHDADAADTLTQECFLRAYQKRASYRGEASLGTWLVRIAVNLAMDHGRNRSRAFWSRLFGASRREAERATAAALEVADPGASPEQSLVAREELAAVWAAADELSPQQRTVFLLRFAHEMTLEEIAESTGLEPGTVKTHLFRAVGAVRKKLSHRGTANTETRAGRKKEK